MGVILTILLLTILTDFYLAMSEKKDLDEQRLCHGRHGARVVQNMVGRLRELFISCFSQDNTHRGGPAVLPGAHEVVEDVPELVCVGGARVVPHGRQQPELVLAPRPQVLRRDALRLAVRQVRHRSEVGGHILSTEGCTSFRCLVILILN